MGNTNIKNYKTYFLLLFDVILIALALGVATIIRSNIEFSINNLRVSLVFPTIQPGIYIIFSIIWIVVFALSGIYNPQDRLSYSILIKLLLASILALMATAGFIKFINIDFSRLLLIIYGLLATAFLIIPRLLSLLILQERLTINHLVRNIAVPLFALLLYSSSISLITHLWFPKGVNYFFSMRLNIILIITLSILFVSLVYIYVENKYKIKFGKLHFIKIQYYEIFLLLIPITPLIVYALNNRDIFVFSDMVLMGIIFFAILMIYIVLFPLLLSPISNKQLLLGIGVSFVYTIINMASLSQTFAWFEEGKFSIQIFVFIVCFIVVWLLLKLKNKRDIVFVAIVFLIGNILVQLPQNVSSDIAVVDPMPQNVSSDIAVVDPMELHPLFKEVEGKDLSRNPNIYFLVYESYAPFETMLGYGIDNSDQGNFLENSGFTHYPHAYTIGSNTLRSISRVLNASVDLYGVLRRGVSGDSVITKILSEYGYKTYGVFPYDNNFRGVGTSYDVSIPDEIKNPPYLLMSAILVGEFRFDLEFELEFYDISYEEFLLERSKVFNNFPQKQGFIYTHFPRPGHSQNSGQCLPDELDRYIKKLETANLVMREDVETIINNDPNSIIIIAGDHGPYMTKNCTVLRTNEYDISEVTRLDIQDRYGTFLAIRWPEEDYIKYDDITVLQDVFVSVLAYLMEDQELLKFKVEPITIEPEEYAIISRAKVVDGIIVGGFNDGEPLFLNE